MGELSLQEICNIIVLISAVIVAVKTIYNFFKAPVDKMSKSAIAREELRIKQVIENVIPDLITEQAKVYVAEYKAQLGELYDSITMIPESLAELKNAAQNTHHDIQELQQSMKLMNAAQLDTLRYNMNRIYAKYRPYHKIVSYDKKAFIKFYEDYHSMGGNTWIDALYSELKDWNVVEDETELKT